MLNGVTKTSKNETKKQKRGFLGISSCTLEASLLGNMVKGKGMLRAAYGNKEGKGMLKTGYGSLIKKN